jgi:hypothetical protein
MYTAQQPPSFTLGHTLLSKKRLGGFGFLLKIALLWGEGFDLKYFGGEVVEGKKILFQAYI